MASQYSHLQFFRRDSNPLLGKYFLSRDAVLDVDLGKLQATEVESVLDAFMQLDSSQ